jgi:DNA-binding XRE family transcriptional regulator
MTKLLHGCTFLCNNKIVVYTKDGKWLNSKKRGIMHMKLKIYLVTNRLTIKEFSEMVGYSRNQISGIANDKLKPSLRLAKVIEQATKGEVTIEDLMKGE